jgi:hypothetical protein
MKIARYWEKASAPARLPSGKMADVTAWGWSSQTSEEARRRARQSAQNAARRLESGDLKSRAPRGAAYGYLDRVPREEILREITDESGEIIALLTRNAAGCVVLSTPALMFMDIDIAPEPFWSVWRRGLQKLFGRTAETPAARILREMRAAATRRREYSFRIYRTKAGYRCLITNAIIAPEGETSQRLLQEFGADVLYQKLCRSHESYRARLSPKFWRCGATRPPHRFPFATPAEETAYHQWQSDYEAKCRAFATCCFMESIGSHSTHAALQPLIALHDKATKADSNLPLA